MNIEKRRRPISPDILRSLGDDYKKTSYPPLTKQSQDANSSMIKTQGDNMHFMTKVLN